MKTRPCGQEGSFTQRHIVGVSTEEAQAPDCLLSSPSCLGSFFLQLGDRERNFCLQGSCLLCTENTNLNPFGVLTSRPSQSRRGKAPVSLPAAGTLLDSLRPVCRANHWDWPLHRNHLHLNHLFQHKGENWLSAVPYRWGKTFPG